MTKTLLFLGYDESRTRLIEFVRKSGWEVTHAEAPRDSLADADLTVSFGYRHVLSEKTLATAPRPPLNLHVGYLPFNRGAHPNFWSFYDATPAGVTIHEIDAGLDTGPIAVQRYVNFAPDETTFAATHARLVREVEDLFEANADALLAGDYEARPQRGAGSFHRTDELPAQVTDWNMEIAPTLAMLDQVYVDGRKRDMALVDEIQAVRTRNNVNWMDLLRIALRHAPGETKAVLRKINADDNSISELFKKLGEE